MADLSNHYRSPYLRCLPHYRTYFPGIFRSCNVAVKSLILTPRRIAFLLIFLMRTLETAWFLFLAATDSGRLRDGTKSNLLWVLVLICMVAFTIELWDLHLIVESEGDGTVWGRRIPEGAFSLFMFWITILHVIMVGLEVTGLAFWAGGKDWLQFEGIVIAIVAGVAWVASREVADGGLSLA